MKRKQAIIAVLACLVFVLDGLIITTCWIKTQAVQKRLEQRHRAIEQFGKIESAAASLGSYAHSYVLNGSQSSLEDYYRSELNVQNSLEALEAIISDNKEQEVHRVGLQDVIGQRLDWEHKVLSTYRSAGRERALALIVTRGGGAAIDTIRLQLNDMENTEKLLLQKDSAEYKLYRSGSLIAIILLTIGGGIALWQAIEMFYRSKSLEADRRLAYERLEQMNKELNKQVPELLKAQKDANNAVAARSQFLARISHELRTPLAGIIGATELVLDTLPAGEQRELIETAKQSGHILLELVNDILDFEKLEQQKLRLEPSAFDLPQAINSALEPLRMRAKGKGISFRVDITDDTPNLVYSDRLRIQQVLVNLVDNATKFTDQGGVTVTVSVDERDSTSASVCFTVSDTGIGIASDRLNQIWEPFNQAPRLSRRSYGGSGLGLSISKKLAEVLHGQIEVSSTPGEGSKFIFKVPLDLREAHPTLSEPQRAVLFNNTASVLVVDDSLTICKVTCAQLETVGCRVEFVTAGHEAIELTSKKRFDLILMDIQMPGMDGIQTTREIRSAPENMCRDVPIIAFTAHAMPGDEKKYLASGLSGYLAKPVMIDGLRDVLKEWIQFGAPKEVANYGGPKNTVVESFHR